MRSFGDYLLARTASLFRCAPLRRFQNMLWLLEDNQGGATGMQTRPVRTGKPEVLNSLFGLQVEPVGVGPFDTDISPSNLCRENSRLLSNNVYSRKRCNNGWCAIMYEYYFEKDISPAGVGQHVHDWENIIVFVKDEKVQRAFSSCHGKYEDDGQALVMEGDRVKFVYHAPESQTHCFRNATEGDSGTQNAQGKWFLGNLVDWNHWPLSLDGYSLRDKMFMTWSSGIAPKLWDFGDTFTKNLEAAAGGGVEGFEPGVDERQIP